MILFADALYSSFGGDVWRMTTSQGVMMKIKVKVMEGLEEIKNDNRATTFVNCR